MHNANMARFPTRFLWASWILIALALYGCDGKDAAEVRGVYDDYNAALRDKNGDAFLLTIDPANVEHYGSFVAVAQKGTAEQVRALSAIGRGYVLQMRHRLKPTELKNLDGPGFVKLSVERGWFFKEDEDEHFALGPIRVKRPRASAELRVNGERTGERLEFVQFQDRWLVNDEGLDRAWEKRLAKLARGLGVTEDSILFEREADDSGEAVDPKILDGPPQLDEPPPASSTPKPKKKPRNP
jgi:hypothetical protein